MPIPQLEPSRSSSRPEHARDASAIRKRRAAEREGQAAGQFRKYSVTDAEEQRKRRPAPEQPVKKKGKKKTRRGKSLKKKILVWGGGAIAVLVGIGAVASVFVFISITKDLADITDLEKRAIAQSTKIYARDGQTLLYEVGDNRRTDVTLDRISDDVEHATIALEDQQFYTHGGVKITSIIRAGLANVFDMETGRGGASTLTQQFIKNAVLSPEQTYTRKIKEALLAVRLEQKYSKDEIIEMYLNEVYFGKNTQGVEAAANIFFNKPAADVTLAEAATLASLPKDPSDLPDHPDRLKVRRDYALDQMVDLGFIEEEEAEAAKAEELVMQEEGLTEISAPHFVFYVRSYLEEKYGQTNVRKGGMKVVTTLDWDKQMKAEEAVRNGIPTVEQYGGSNAALVSIDAHTGQVLAMVGSRDYFDDSHDGQVNVATSLRQPGSSFKPIVYLAGFLKGYTPDTRLFDIETDFPTETGNYHPRNYDLSQRGPVTLRYALGQSLNIPAVKLLYLVGVNNALDIAERLGYSSFTDRSRFGLALVLGGGEVSLLEHTSTFATFAREGEYHKPVTVLRVEDQKGELLEEWVDNPIQAVDNEGVRTLNSVLSDSSARGGFYALNLSDRVVAAKTGTTNDYRDAWTIGYTPSVATGVWAGNNDNSEMARGAAGLVIAAPIWNAYMESILAGTPAESFNAPTYTAANSALGGQLETTETRKVDAISGELIPDECIGTYPATYVADKEFKVAHTILYFIDKENPTGGPPSNPAADPMFNNWEGAVQGWARSDERKMEYLTDSTPKASCTMRDEAERPEVTITSLNSGATYKKKDFSIAATFEPGSGRTITEVKFYIDSSLVDHQYTSITVPTGVTANANISSLTSGSHTITAWAADDKGNTSEDTISIMYDAPEAENAEDNAAEEVNSSADDTEGKEEKKKD